MEKKIFFFINSENVLDYTIRFENLEEDIKILLDKLNIPNNFTKLPRYRTTKGNINPIIKKSILKNYKLFYNKMSKQIIDNNYKKYIKTFNYTF